jgi:hypothetical protein
MGRAVERQVVELAVVPGRAGVAEPAVVAERVAAERAAAVEQVEVVERAAEEEPAAVVGRQVDQAADRMRRHTEESRMCRGCNFHRSRTREG